MAATSPGVPDHVPPELVFDYDYRHPPALKTGDPHSALVGQAAGRPRVFWSPAAGGFWVLTRAEDIVHVLPDYRMDEEGELRSFSGQTIGLRHLVLTWR